MPKRFIICMELTVRLSVSLADIEEIIEALYDYPDITKISSMTITPIEEEKEE